MLSLGLATAAAIGFVLGVLCLFPISASLVSNPALAQHLPQIGTLPTGPTPRPRSR